MRPGGFARVADRPRLAGARGGWSLGQPEPEACSGAERSLLAYLLEERSLHRVGRRRSPLVLYTGSGELSLEELQHALRDGAFERSRSVPLTAPAHGLVLHRVIFPPDEGPFAGAAAELDLEEELEEGSEVQ